MVPEFGGLIDCNVIISRPKSVPDSPSLLIDSQNVSVLHVNGKVGPLELRSTKQVYVLFIISVL